MKYLFWVFSIVVWSSAQVQALPVKADSVFMDTTRLLSDVPLKNPTGALLRSAVIPGWGQLYNHQYPKAAIAFTINGYFIYKIWDFHRQWRRTHDQGFRDRRNLFTWYWGIAYALTLLDAYVDAYLFGFDRAMDISIVPGSTVSGGVVVWNVKITF